MADRLDALLARSQLFHVTGEESLETHGTTSDGKPYAVVVAVGQAAVDNLRWILEQCDRQGLTVLDPRTP